MNFLYLFLRVLIEAGGRYELTPEDEKALFAAIERAYKLPAEIRTLTNFASILGPLGERLHRWTQAGQFGHLFDNPQDTLTFSRFQTFNFDGWSDYPDILEPLLFYVLAAGIVRDRKAREYRDIQGVRHRRGVDLPQEQDHPRLDNQGRENLA